MFDNLIQKKRLKIYTNKSITFYIVFYFHQVTMIVISDWVKRRKSSTRRLPLFFCSAPRKILILILFIRARPLVSVQEFWIFVYIRSELVQHTILVEPYFTWISSSTNLHGTLWYDSYFWRLYSYFWSRTMSPGETILLVIWFGMHAKITICGSWTLL